MNLNFNYGVSVGIHEKIETTDTEGNPAYMWNLRETVKGFISKSGRDIVVFKEGIPDLKRHMLFIFPPETAINEGERIKYQNAYYRVIGVRNVAFRDFVVCREVEAEVIED